MTKRVYGRGGISERKNKAGDVVSYLAQVWTEGGRRSYIAKTKPDAQQWLKNAQKLAAQGQLGSPKTPPLATYLSSTWLPTIEVSVRPRTIASYRLNVQRIPDELGKRKLDELKPAHVQDFYNLLTSRGLAPRTVRQIHMTLHKALEDALMLGYVTRNATDGTVLPRIKGEERTWYTSDQVACLFEATAGDRFDAMWVVLGTLGLRLGEALGLKWSDVDWERRTLTVQRTLSRDRSGGGLTFNEPKTKRSRRTLTFGKDALQALKAHQERQMFERRKYQDLWQDNGLIFCTSLGTPLDQQRVHRHWSAAVEKAGIPRYRIHDLRHSVASNLLAAGCPVERVARMLGHSSVTMLYDVYGHIIPADYREEADAMDAMLAKHRAK
jgi:integrase